MFDLVPIGDVRFVSLVMGLGPGQRDLHFDQRALAPYVAALGWKGYLAFTGFEHGYIIQPLLITKEGELRHSYNFGGPIASSELVNPQEHVDNIQNWATKEGLKHQSCTLVPFLTKNQLELLKKTDVIADYSKESVMIDLNNQKIRATTRRSANKAQSAGVKVNSYPLTSLKSFIDIYESTMDRNEAKPHWRFSAQWFEAFARFLKPMLFLAEYDGKAEGGCLVLFSQQYPVAYYHFAGTYNRHPKLGIMPLIVLSVCEFVKSTGIRYLYLGGGRTADPKDDLLMFKAGFSKERLPVFTYRISY